LGKAFRAALWWQSSWSSWVLAQRALRIDSIAYFRTNPRFLSDYSVSSDFDTTVSGTFAALVATLSSSAQQVGVAYLGRKYTITTTELVGEVFYLQALTLLIFGPILDFYLVNTFFSSWLPAQDALRRIVYMLMSCTLAVLVNYSQVRRKGVEACRLILTIREQFKCISQLSATGKGSVMFVGYWRISHLTMPRFSGSWARENSCCPRGWLAAL
jgi:hypothetical protein